MPVQYHDFALRMQNHNNQLYFAQRKDPKVTIPRWPRHWRRDDPKQHTHVARFSGRLFSRRTVQDTFKAKVALEQAFQLRVRFTENKIRPLCVSFSRIPHWLFITMLLSLVHHTQIPLNARICLQEYYNLQCEDGIIPPPHTPLNLQLVTDSDDKR